MAHTFHHKWENVPFSLRSSWMYHTISLDFAAATKRTLRWVFFFFFFKSFFYVNGCFQGEVRNSISTLKTGSPSEHSEENVTVNKFRLLKKTCDAIKSERFPGAEVIPSNCSTKNLKTFISKCCMKATPMFGKLAWSTFTDQQINSLTFSRLTNQ